MEARLNQAIAKYQTKWQKLLGNLKDQTYFSDLQPTSVAWKTSDLEEFQAFFAELQKESLQVHLAWVNERWLATVVLKKPLAWDITLVKLMQRRPNSTDAIGLDHLDFYVTSNQPTAKLVVEKEPILKWSEERNGEHCRWLSLWFDDTEAKLRSDTVLDVCAAELKTAEQTLLGPR